MLVLDLPADRGHASPVPWWLLALGFAAAESAVIHLQVRRDSVSVSFGEIPLVIGLAFTAPIEFVVANVAGSVLVLLVHRRQRGLKLAFNFALFAVEAAIAKTVYSGITGAAEPATLQAGLATLAAVLSADLFSALAITAVICLSTGRIDREPLVEVATTGLFGSVANTSAALLAVILLVRQPAGVILLLVVLAALLGVYRAYATLGRGHARLKLLYQFTRGVAGQGEMDHVPARVLSEARDTTQSRQALLVLLPTPVRARRDLRLNDGAVIPSEVEGPDVSACWWAPAAAGQAIRYPRGSQPDSALAASGLTDGMAAPLQSGALVFGVLTVAGRPRHLATYSPDDMRLFQSLADHAAVALANVALVDELRDEVAEREHQALHDALSGLPNRRRFLERLGQETSSGQPFTVVMLDLVGFGEINDALGYETGDSLLVEVGRRLADRLGGEQVARLGNDEYAAILRNTPDAQSAQLAATALLRTLDAPFPVSGFSLDIVARAGVAVCPAHGTDPAQLLRRANGALAAADRDATPLSVYSVWQDQNSARRLQLVSDLRAAVANHDLTVDYQPKVDARTGRPCGVEALVRWTHPQLGRIGPDEFIPLAEHSGLVGDLTTLVLRAAVKECARWRADGHEVGIAVNLSTRSLTDPDLPDRVAAELATAGVPAEALTLEITESAVMTDIQHSLDVLHRLRALDVRLSVDDFGTGQSSLAYLQNLPVQELKIDKAFIQGMATKPVSMAIVQAAIDLAHAMGLTTVAEGVEDEFAQRRLAAAGCDVLQGYLFSRPLSAEQIGLWLDSYVASAALAA